MIKLTLVKFIRQFSLRKSWLEFNHLFLQGLGVTLGSILLVVASMSIYSRFLAKDYEWGYIGFWEQLIFLVTKSADGSAQQLSMLLSYSIAVIAVLKMRRSHQLDQAVLPPKLLESLTIGFLIVFAATVLFGHGLYWFFGIGAEHYGMAGYGMFLFTRWLTALFNTLLPAASFYTAYYFLKRGMEKQQQKFWPDFPRILVIYTIVMTFISLMVVIFGQVILQPLALLLGGFENSPVSIVLLSLLVLGMLIFFIIVASDLLIILVNKKTNSPAIAQKTNPDLLDR